MAREKFVQICPECVNFATRRAYISEQTTMLRGSLHLIIITLLAKLAIAGAEHPGASIYQKQCAECHGADGQGVLGEYDDPLVGDRSIKSLAKLIERTMPEQDETLCVGDDAAAVAEFIHGAFYSPEARKRLGLTPTVKIELARRTVPQYRNAIADIIESLDPGRTNPSYTSGGLRGSYFSSDKMNKKDKHGLDRTDPVIDFDFKEGPPAEGIDATQFSIAWEGSLVAPDTGSYEFRVTTPNGVRLYVNADLKEGDRNMRDDSSAPSRVPLIDGWVSTGKEVRELHARTELLGGRRYPIRLDYFKYKEKFASLKFEWKPPHGTWSLLGGEHLSPDPASRTMVVTTPFPADDRSYGYERGTTISKEWHEATTKAAVEVANEILDRIDGFIGGGGRRGGEPQDDAQRAEKLKQYCSEFASTAFRRPLTEAERKLFVDAQFAATDNLDTALKRCILLTLNSPRFLYTEIPGGAEKPDSYTVASRLALALWDSIPDQPLLLAAKQDQLQTREQIAAQAHRMIADQRAKQKVDAFFEHWLELEERDLSKDSKLYPQFDAQVFADLRHSLHLFIDAVVWGEGSDYPQLLLADYLILNQPLAELYGVPAGSAGFTQIKFDPQQRSGVLTHPYLLSAFAYHNNTSPIHRGVFLTRNIVGRRLKPPPVAVAFKNDEFDPTLTMREKVTHLTKDTACMSCHSVINPLGFSLESFDAVGRWRTTDNQKQVDTETQYTTLDGETISLRRARDIANHAADSPAAHRAFITALFHSAVKQPVAAYGANTLEDLRESFQQSGFNIRELLANIATTTALQSN